MNIFSKKETPYKETKEYLDKQQKIDMLLALGNLINSVGINEDNIKLTNKKITSILEDIK